MVRERLLLLYPRAWRERYGDEFLATLDRGPLRASQLIDIALGALDARFSADVRHSTMFTSDLSAGATAGASGAAGAGGVRVCAPRQAGVTPRDGLIGAAVMIGATLLFKALMMAAARSGRPDISALLNGFSFVVPFTISMPFWLMRGTSWRIQTAIVSATLLVLIAIGLFPYVR